jgi:hypothetical protein
MSARSESSNTRENNGAEGSQAAARRSARRAGRNPENDGLATNPEPRRQPTEGVPGNQRPETNEEIIARLRRENQELRQQQQIQQLVAEQEQLRRELGREHDSVAPASVRSSVPSPAPDSNPEDTLTERRQIERGTDPAPDSLQRSQSGTAYTVETEDEENDIYPNLSMKELKRRQDTEKGIKTNTPSEYHGKNIDEHQAFFDIWENIFELQPYTYNLRSRRVLAATVLLRGQAQKLWATEKATYRSTSDLRWKPFKEFLRNLIVNPGMQKQESFEEMRALRQRSNERINGLLTRFYTLEGVLGTSAEEDRVRTLNAAVDDEIRDRMGFENPPRTVLAWVARATEAEHFLAKTKKRRKENQGQGQSKDQTPGNPHGSKSDSSGKRNAGRGDATSRRKRKEAWRKDSKENSSAGGDGQKGSGSSSGTITCWTCNKQGHYSGDPKCEKYDEWQKQKKDKASGNKPKGVHAAKKDSGKDTAKP